MRTLFASGFRPFFLLCALSGLLLVPVWVAALSGHALPGVDLRWHAHELIFGFAGALMAGFFLTATPKWTESTPVTGSALAALAALWVSARVARALSPDWPIDALFLVLVTGQLAFVIARARSSRNVAFPLLLFGLAGADLVVHLRPELAAAAERAAVFCVLGVIAIFGGRITRLFTANAIRPEPVRDRGLLDDAAIAGVLLLIPLAAWPRPALVGPVALVGGALNLLRPWGWGGRHTLDNPLLAVLHVGYAWVGVALLAWGLAALRPDWLAPSTALHAATVGALGTFSVAMMSRVTLGHTGRPLRVGAPMTVAFVAMVAAGLLRLGSALASSTPMLHAAGACWTLALLLFLVRFGPRLLTPRVDGRPG